MKEIATTEDGLGITHVDGLGKKDLDRVQSLALIDLTALFDMYGITYVRRKAKGRGKGQNFCLLLKGKESKAHIQLLMGLPSHRYGTSPAIWDHTQLPATRHK